MASQEVRILAIKTDQERTKLVNPGETAFTGEPSFVDLGVEQAFTTTFGRFTVAFVFGHIGDYPMIEAGFAGIRQLETRLPDYAVSVEEAEEVAVVQ